MSFLHVPSAAEIKSGEVMGRQRFTALAANIGNAIEAEVNAQIVMKHVEQNKQANKSKIYDLHVKGKLNDSRVRSVIMRLARKDLESNEKWAPKWAPTITLTVGSTLISMLVLCGKLRIKSTDLT